MTDAILSKDAMLANVGKPLNSVPLHSASLWSVYRFRHGALTGWGNVVPLGDPRQIRLNAVFDF